MELNNDFAFAENSFQDASMSYERSDDINSNLTPEVPSPESLHQDRGFDTQNDNSPPNSQFDASRSDHQVQEEKLKWKKNLLQKQQQLYPGTTKRTRFDSGVAESVENNTDHSWMDQRPVDDENADEQQAKFEIAEKSFNAKRSSGTTNFAEEIAFRKYKRLHKQKMQKLLNDDQIELSEEQAELEGGDSNKRANEDSLFVHDSDTEHPETKRAKRTLSEDLNLYAAAVEDDVDEEDNNTSERLKVMPKTSQKSKRAKVASTKTTTAMRSNNKSKNSAKCKPPTKKALAQSRAVNNVVNVTNLLNSNIFRDTETNTGFTEIPTFTATNKADAMKELISSLPAEYRSIANMDKKQLMQALKSFTGRGSCGSDGNGQWKVHGMISVLSHYQMLGVSVMRERESQMEEPRGGILADQMGLGKTVMMIANIVNGMKVAGKSAKPTLIVAPSALLTQWMDELVKHADGKILGEVIRYHGNSRLITQDPVASLSNYSVILTTYNEIAKSYPKYDPPVEATTPEEVDAWWNKTLEEERGPLHHVKFHRVILDEAQAIKNHASQTSLGCRALLAVHRWAISGTPVQNSLAEFYPYFKFLQVPFTGSFKVFKRNFCSQSDTQGIERLSLYLRQFMIRRTHNDSLFGAKLLVLPKPTKKDLPCHFSKIEREIYTVVRTRFVSRINRLSRSGQLRKNYSHVLTMLLRLRQLVGHPLLIQDTLRDLLEPEDFNKLRKITQLPVPQHSTEAAILNHLRLMLRTPKSLTQLDIPSHSQSPPANFGEMMEDAQTGPEFINIQPFGGIPDSQPVAVGDQQESDTIPNATNAKTIPDHLATKTGKAFGLKNSYADYLDDLNQSSGYIEEEAPRTCSRCHESSDKNYITNCNHVYCYECLMYMSAEAAFNNEDHTLCIECNKVYTVTQTYSAGMTDKAKSKKGDKYSSSCGSPTQEPSLEDDQSEKPKKLSPQQVVDTWVDANGHMLPSTKTLAIKAQILNWMQESPGCKIIIYSQFITMIRIITKMCAIEQWGAIQFTGLQSMDRRAQGLKMFEKDPNINILIASLKTGGVGLNLTCASKILMVDLWWNSAVEDQAFCRSYRRGQTRETEMTRLLVTNTVDSDMVKVQKRKDQEIEGIMIAEGGKKNFTTHDMLSLFGAVDKDENGREFILVNDRASYAIPPRPTFDDAMDSRARADAF